MGKLINSLPLYLVSLGIASFGFISNFDFVTGIAQWGIIAGILTTTFLLIKDRRAGSAQVLGPVHGRVGVPQDLDR